MLREIMHYTELDFSRPKKRSVMLAGHRTSFTLEDNFWNLLKKLAEKKGISLAQLINDIDSARAKHISDPEKRDNVGGLSSAIRAVILHIVKIEDI